MNLGAIPDSVVPTVDLREQLVMLSSIRQAPCCLTTPKRTSLDGLPACRSTGSAALRQVSYRRAIRIEGFAPTNRSYLIDVKNSYGCFEEHACLANLHISMPLSV
ncbi:hypothetical protein AAE026_13370 [Bradyrhizobium sp. DN5]